MKNRILEIEEILQDVIGKLVILSGEAFFMQEVLRKLMLETKALLTIWETEYKAFHCSDKFREILNRVEKRVEYAEETLDESK